MNITIKNRLRLSVHQRALKVLGLQHRAVFKIINSHIWCVMLLYKISKTDAVFVALNAEKLKQIP
jgi:hypothetical protein